MTQATAPVPRYLDAKDHSDLVFSICSLVRDVESYDRLLASFGRLGFTPENSEFLAADNRTDNQFDGYSWHKTLLGEARGRFVVFCHDDIELIDAGFTDLLAWTQWLDETDPDWLLAGVAGGVWHKAGNLKPAMALHISDKFGRNRRRGTVPNRVESLDECFILMRRNRPVISSYDLGGFHFYGLDLCLQAELLGGSAYVIDFHVFHHGQGATGKPFRLVRRKAIAKYRRYFPNRVVNTVNGLIDLKPEETPPDA